MEYSGICGILRNIVEYPIFVKIEEQENSSVDLQGPYTLNNYL